MKTLASLLVLMAQSAALGAGFDINVLTALASQTKSVEELLERLPADYKQNYVLVYDSQSLQKATPLQPRAILYGRGESGLTLSFSTIMQGGGNSQAVEAMQFDPRARRFDMFDISYQAPGRAAPVVSKNPKMCLSCHRADARPNWAKFDLWPGVYGSDAFLREDSIERRGYSAFAQTAGAHPRYKHLAGIEPTGRAYFDRAPARRLQEIFSNQNDLRLARLVAELKGYEKFKYAIAGAVDNAGDIEGYFPESLKAGKPRYAQVLEDTYSAIDGFHRYAVKRHMSLLDQPVTDAQIQANP
ncbi:MAG TPA: hypothetical protein VFV50_15070, partial [Bdellovibrionales bacterium]|nr:hypothetical protein [Bdellovibrionales bacterium]